MNLFLAEVKSLRRVITHLSEDVLSLRNEVRTSTLHSSYLSYMPFNKKAAFNDFIKELLDKESVLNEFLYKKCITVLINMHTRRYIDR